MATSPDGSSVVTAGADETLRFWRAFGDAPGGAKDDKGSGAGGLGLAGMMGGAGGPLPGGGAMGSSLRSIR